MTIPRSMEIETPQRLLDLKIEGIESSKKSTGQHFIRAGLLLLNMILSSTFSMAVVTIFNTLDFVSWVIIILALSGPMLLSGLHEALVDYRVLESIPEIEENPPSPSSEKTKTRTEACAEVLTVLVAGNLDRRELEPHNKLDTILVSHLDSPNRLEKCVGQLLYMMSSQPSFGSSVGGAVLFYCGSFIYTILDIQNKRGDTDTADALAFGMWWMTVVHVSIVAGCLLASNNPSTAATLTGLNSEPETGIFKPFKPSNFLRKWAEIGCKILNFGIKPVYPGIYQPVWMWQRGNQKMLWLRNTFAWTAPSSRFKKSVELRLKHWGMLLIATVFLLLIPALLAFVVEYMSPKKGLGCRSFTVLLYFISQVVLTILTFLHYTRPTEGWDNSIFHKIWRLTYWIFVFLGVPALLLALLTAVGVTLMEMIGVYQSCLCGVSVYAWTNDINSAVTYLASDTQAFRDSARLWSRTGYIAVGFIGIMCYAAYRFQRYLRIKFKRRVEEDLGHKPLPATPTGQKLLPHVACSPLSVPPN